MSETTPTEQNPGTGNRPTLPWTAAALLAVLALVGGIFLGRVSFFANNEPTPRVVEVEVEDEELEVGGNVEYFEDKEIYILTIRTLPPPPENQVYAVWMQTGDVTVCAGIMNPDSQEFAYAAYSGRYETLSVTLEEGRYCGDSPRGEPLITADLTEIEDEDD